MSIEGEIIVSAAKFKATCLELMGNLARHKLSRVTVTKRGRPVATMTPSVEAGRKPVYGCMKGAVHVPPRLDLTAPVIDPEDVEAFKGDEA